MRPEQAQRHAALREPDPSILFSPFADIHLFITSWKKRTFGKKKKKNAHMALVKQLRGVASGRGAPAACHLPMFGWRNVLVCISSAPCVCCSTHDKRSQWNGTLRCVIEQVVTPGSDCMGTGRYGDTSIYHSQIHWFIHIMWFIIHCLWDHGGDVWLTVKGTEAYSFFIEFIGSSRC